MRAYYLFNKIQNSLLSAFIFASIFVLSSEVLDLFNHYIFDDNKIVNEFAILFNALLPYVFCYFITLYFSYKNRRLYVLWSLICLAVFNTASGYSSLFLGIVISLLLCLAYKNLDKTYALAITIIASAVFGVLLYFLSSYIENLQMNVAYFITRKGVITPAIFGALKNFYSLFDYNFFSELFYTKSYGGSVIINEELITGIKDLLQAGYKGELVSKFLSGQFYILYAIVGITLSLSDELKGAQKLVVIIIAISSVLSGNYCLFLIFIFFESWHLFISFLLVSALAYLSATLLDLQIGYLLNGGIIELLINLNKPVYALLGGLVFVAIGYFVSKYMVLKYGISDSLNIYYPTRYKKIIKALGGIVNIIKVYDCFVEVRNPKIINTFDLDCDINENIIKINNEAIIGLEEYIK